MMAAVDSAFLRSRASDRHSSTAFIMCLLFQQAKAVPRIYAEAECLALPAHIQVTENISRGDIDSANIDKLWADSPPAQDNAGTRFPAF
jgi:hypothetical protein